MHRPLQRFLRHALQNEDGTTAFSLMWLSLCIILGGLAVDISNGQRLKALMDITAEVAAHAGAVAVRNGGDPTAVRAAVLASVESNMPVADHGNMFDDQAVDVQLLQFDPETNQLGAGETPNTVFVQLHRNDGLGNALATHFLRLADAFDGNGVTDYSHWNVSGRGLATFVEAQGCKGDDWIYSRLDVKFTSSNYFGPRYCIHGQTGVSMSMKNIFDTDVGVSMPDLAVCGTKCTDAANPGIEAAAFEQNMILDDANTLIDQLALDFKIQAETSQNFFATRTLDSNLTEIDALPLYSAADLTSGSVINLSDDQFEALDHISAGLTYVVNCFDEVPLLIDAPISGATVRDIALVTNCALEFDGTANLEGSMIISTSESSSATVTANSGSRVGTLVAECQPSLHTFVYSKGGVHFPARTVGSNITFRSAGNVHFSAASSSEAYTNYGLSIYADRGVHIAAGHTFSSCTPPGTGRNSMSGHIRMLELAGIAQPVVTTSQ